MLCAVLFYFVLLCFVLVGKDYGLKVTGEDCREGWSVCRSGVVMGRRQVGLLFFILVLFIYFINLEI